MDSSGCKARRVKNEKAAQKLADAAARKARMKTWFGMKRTTKVATTSTSPGIIHGHPHSLDPVTHLDDAVETGTSNGHAMAAAPLAPPPSSASNIIPQTRQRSPPVRPAVITQLEDFASRLSPPEGKSNDFLQCFDRLPVVYDIPHLGVEELWEEVVNPILHSALGYNNAGSEEQVAGLRPQRLRGLVHFVEYYVDERGVDLVLLEARLNNLVEMLKKW